MKLDQLKYKEVFGYIILNFLRWVHTVIDKIGVTLDNDVFDKLLSIGCGMSFNISITRRGETGWPLNNNPAWDKPKIGSRSER